MYIWLETRELLWQLLRTGALGLSDVLVCVNKKWDRKLLFRNIPGYRMDRHRGCVCPKVGGHCQIGKGEPQDSCPRNAGRTVPCLMTTIILR